MKDGLYGLKHKAYVILNDRCWTCDDFYGLYDWFPVYKSKVLSQYLFFELENEND